MDFKIIGLASDHAGFELKQYVKQYLDEKGVAYKDYGTFTEESCDYPDFAHALAQGIESGEVYPGIGICGSGEGIAMTLNKHQGVRAGLAWNREIAHLIRQHNDANIAGFGVRQHSAEEAMRILDAFIAESFSGDARHQGRIDQVRDYERARRQGA